MNRIVLPLVMLLFGCGGSEPLPEVPATAASAVNSKGLNSQATTALSGLKGKTLTDTRGALGGGNWTIGELGAAGGDPNSLSLVQGTVTKQLPIGTEGDVADLVTRVTGQPSTLVKGGELSSGYQKALGLGGAAK